VHAKFWEGFFFLRLNRISRGKAGKYAWGIILEKSKKNRRRIIEIFGECRPDTLVYHSLRLMTSLTEIESFSFSLSFSLSLFLKQKERVNAIKSCHERKEERKSVQA
jgi:hypothetical protein